VERIEINICEKEWCAKLVIYKDYTEMHGKQNIENSLFSFIYVTIIVPEGV